MRKRASRDVGRSDIEKDYRKIWSSEKGSTVDALELSVEEGRGKLRKASGRSKHPMIRGYPNGVTSHAFEACDAAVNT